jgi:hypothetical protein
VINVEEEERLLRRVVCVKNVKEKDSIKLVRMSMFPLKLVFQIKKKLSFLVKEMNTLNIEQVI